MFFRKVKDKTHEEGILTPSSYLEYNLGSKNFKKFPKKFILLHYLEILEYFKKKYKPKKIKVTRLLTIYQYKDIGVIGLVGVGCPNAVRLFEELIALGGTEFLNIGSAGGLDSEGIFLCSKAYVDEGTSKHYLHNPKITFPNVTLTNRFEKALRRNNFDFLVSSSWTTDALYRETPTKVKKFKKKGVKTVEMEASALFAVAKVRKVKMAACFVVSDVLRENCDWHPKYKTKKVKDKLNSLVDVGIEALKKN